MFRGDELVECAVLNELDLTAGKKPRRKTQSDGVRRFNEEQQVRIARLRREVKYCKRQAAFRTTSVFSEGNRGGTRNRAGSNDSRSRGGSTKEPERNCNRKR